MTRSKFTELYDKYLSGNITPEEREQLFSYQDEFQFYIPTDDDKKDLGKTGDKLLKRINNSTGHGSATILQRMSWWPAAAAILLFITAALYFLNTAKKDDGMQVRNKTIIIKHDVGPGSNKAILTLANGKVIALNSAANGIINRQGGVLIKKKKDGLIAYELAPKTAGDRIGKVDLNTVSTQPGGQYQVVLPDGTKVWLNAASSLQFPSAFSGKERDVTLTGEAYFEVAKNKNMPFKVKFNDEEIEVLGTHFNIKAYDNEEETRATLLEGCVKITNGKNQNLLVPGQCAVTSRRSGEIKVFQANAEEALAWKNGYFIFHDEDIQQIMRDAARWYDVDVVYSSNLTGMVYGGRVSKYKNISALLKNLELTGTIHFKVQGRRVTVME